MIKEALEYFARKVSAAETPQEAPGVALRNASLLFHQGELQRIVHDAPAKAHDVRDLDSLATLVNGPGDDIQPLRPHASVWHAGDVVVAVFDDRDGTHRDDRATWRLVPSRKFFALTVQAASPRAHKAFIQFLVENLRDELEASAPGLLGTLRKLKFASSRSADSGVQHGRASYGLAVEAEVTGAAEPLPETVVIRVRRWADLEYVTPVECLLILDPEEETLALRPLADELQEAENVAHRWLHDRITGEVDCPVYYGTP